VVLCETCGSVRISKAEPQTIDQFWSMISPKRPFICRRCGWRARRAWTDADLEKLKSYGAGGAHYDPALVVLDKPQRGHGRPRSRRKFKSRESKSVQISSGTVDAFDFDLKERDGAALPPVSQGTDTPIGQLATVEERNVVKKRRQRTRYLEVLTTALLTMLLMLAVALVTVTDGCAPRSDL